MVNQNTTLLVKLVVTLDYQRMDWNIRDDNGDTPIMIALRNKEVEMVRILLKTPGVDLGDITNTKAGIDLMKEMGADQMRADLLSKVPE